MYYLFEISPSYFYTAFQSFHPLYECISVLFFGDGFEEVVHGRPEGLFRLKFPALKVDFELGE